MSGMSSRLTPFRCSISCVAGTGHQAGFDPFSGNNRDGTFVRTDPDTGRFATQDTRVDAAGVTAEFKFYKDERNIDLKLYGNHHQFLNEGGGAGTAVGVLARLNAGTDWISAFRLKGEYRTYEDGFLPGYFPQALTGSTPAAFPEPEVV